MKKAIRSLKMSNGSDVSREKMGRMIAPFLLQDNYASIGLAWSADLKNWDWPVKNK